MQLNRAISSISLLATALGGIIGSGWLFGPLYASQMAGPASVFSWVLGGLLMSFIALTFAELSAMFPIAGGFARFTHFSHGTLVSFSMSWCGWISSVAVAPLETMALLQYSSNYLPWLTEKIGQVEQLTPLGVLLAAFLMLIMCIINLYGIRLLAKSNLLIVAIKVFVPLFTIVVLVSHSFNSNNFIREGFAPMGIKGVLAALPAAGVIFSFIGYNPAIQLAGEAKKPQKALPLAILGGITLGLILYVLVQITFIGALQGESLNNGWGQLQYSGDSGPFVGIASILGLTYLVAILYFDAVLSPFGTGLIYTSAASRINIAMSKNGYWPAIMEKLNRKKVPYVALIFNYSIGLILFLPFPGWQSLVTFLVSAFIFSYAVGPLALLSLRKKIPEQARPFKLFFPRTVSFIAFYICNLLAFWTGWETIWKILAALGIGYIFLYFYRKTKKGRELSINWQSSWWLIPYYLGIGLISYLGSFKGGINIITFGVDFFVVLIFSAVVFLFAVDSSRHHDIVELPDIN